MESREQVEFNIEVHDRITRKYERVHGEIFNPIEQQRLHGALAKAVEAVQTTPTPLRAFDFGCGSGNLTQHLLELGAEVTSADVSPKFLEIIEKRFSQTGRSRTFRLNGTDLSEVDSDQFDLVATYSVLHHVPDYLAIVREMCRVLKPGGVIYIDHEVVESYYDRTAEYVEFLRQVKPRFDARRYLRYLLDVKGYVHIIRRLLNPRYKREGDIHVWPDDHIEWPKIRQILQEYGFEVFLDEDYLLYRARYKQEIYEAFKSKCSDQHVLAARKPVQ